MSIRDERKKAAERAARHRGRMAERKRPLPRQCDAAIVEATAYLVAKAGIDLRDRTLLEPAAVRLTDILRTSAELLIERRFNPRQVHRALARRLEPRRAHLSSGGPASLTRTEYDAVTH